ncbi:hypothetical protein LTR49_024933 [Elasticomyces elasticus]|nr:hypothetical protein LTR49_024933 [Elasticomyces elasticus]
MSAMASGTSSRPMSVRSRNTPTLEPTPLHDSYTTSSGDTTIVDDVDIMGQAGNQKSGEPEDAMQVLDQHSRKLIHVIQNLALLNIDATLPSLPTFVVAGDQSAGKSSIVGAICDITVPRDQGTCTRCPFRFTTSSSSGEGASWMCTVSVHHAYAFDSAARAGDDPNKYDHCIIYEREQLQNVLHRAQLAILHHGHNPTEFLSGAFPTDPGVGFSPNFVSTRIESPDLPELSFFDLPGAINVHADGQNYLVSLAEKLIKSFLKKPKTLVLLACSADQDIENSGAFRYVGQCDALYRCIGVLTRPDLVGAKRDALLERILSGEKFKLGSPNACFVTKQPSQEELEASSDLNLGATRRVARDAEMSFFGEGIWSTTLVPFADRFGTAKLQAAISHRLTQHILGQLPDIAARVNNRLEAGAFSISPSISPRQSKSGRPVVKLSTPGYVKPLIAIDIDDDYDDDDATPATSPDPTPSKKRKVSSGRTLQQTPSQRSFETPRSRREKGCPADAMKEVARNTALQFALDKLSDKYKHGSNSDLPNQLNPRVTNNIIYQSQRNWNVVVETTLSAVRHHVGDMLRKALSASMVAKRHNTLFLATTEDTLVTFFSRIWDQECERILRCVKLEQHKPLTYAFISPQVDGVAKKLRHDRLTERINEYDDTQESKGYKAPVTDADRQKKRADQQESVLNTEEYDCIIGVVTSVLAYYDLAVSHLIGSITKELQFDLLFVFERHLWETLRAALRMTDEA